MANFLPPGFDPATGRFTNITSGIPHTPRSTTRTYTVHNTSVWGRICDAIENFGDRLADLADDIANYVMWGALILIAITGIVGIVMTFITEGIFIGILATMLILVIGYYGAYIIGGLFYVVTYALMMALHFICYNVWTLIATIVLITGISIYSAVGSGFGTIGSGDMQEVEVVNNTYRCTASVLNARSGPGTKYKVIRKLHKGDTFDVIDITKGFAHIKYNGEDLYVSQKYIEKL